MWPPWHWAKAIFTGRNEVVAKVMFLLMSVILSMGGVCLSACWDTTPPEQTPLSRHPPRADISHPLAADTPQSRHHPQADPPGADPPRADPPRADTPEQTPPPESRLQHTVNERPVRILLECILVFPVKDSDLCRSSVWTVNWIINLWTHLEAMSLSLSNPQFAFESVTTFQCVKKFL